MKRIKEKNFLKKIDIFRQLKGLPDLPFSGKTVLIIPGATSVAWAWLKGSSVQEMLYYNKGM